MFKNPLRKDKHLDMLRVIASKAAMPMDDWLRHVPRKQKNHHDFFEAAALFHCGYVETTTEASQGRPAGHLGDDIDDTAQILCQFTLEPGETFQTDPLLCPRERWDPKGFRVFVTERGIEKLNEVRNRSTDHRLAIAVGVLSAIIGAVATKFVGGAL